MKQLQSFNTLRKITGKGYTERGLSFDLVKANSLAFISTYQCSGSLVLYKRINGVDQAADPDLCYYHSVGRNCHSRIDSWCSRAFLQEQMAVDPLLLTGHALPLTVIVPTLSWPNTLVIVLPTLLLGFLPYLTV